jgi:hypothetical protein
LNLDRIQINPRLRNSWEAIDLGFVMARAWWKPLMLSWLLPALIVFSVLSLVMPNNNLLAFMITWWLKPLFDRAPLHIASRRLFGESVGVVETFRILHRLYLTDMLAWLFWRRLSLTRSFDMPVTVLENLNGDKRNQRLFVLHQHTSNAATWLTIVCVNMEMTIVFGILGMAVLLIPEQSDFHLMSFYMDGGNFGSFVINACSFLAMSLVAPFYTMAGFALYINRRISLEAWDIEIRFRHMAEKFKKQLFSSAAIFLLLAGLVFQFVPQVVMAEDHSGLTPEKSTSLVNEILEADEFHQQIFREGWRLKSSKDQEKQDSEVPEWILSIIRFLESLKSDKTEVSRISAANILEVLLWLGAALLIAIVIRLLYRYRHVFKPRTTIRSGKGADVVPDILFGLDVRKSSLPDDVAGQALVLWEQGKQRDAVGLLYRAMLSQLINGYGFKFDQSSTELECVVMVQSSYHGAIKKYVHQLTVEWQKIAYAHVFPEEQQLRQLCNEWRIMERHES